MFGQSRNLVRRDDPDFRIIGKPLFEAGAHGCCGFAQNELAAGVSDDVGVQRLARAVIQHPRVGCGHQRRDFFRDQPIVHILVAGTDVNECGLSQNESQSGIMPATASSADLRFRTPDQSRAAAPSGSRRAPRYDPPCCRDKVVFAARRIRADNHKVRALGQPLMAGAGRQNDDVAGSRYRSPGHFRRRSAPWRGRGRRHRLVDHRMIVNVRVNAVAPHIAPAVCGEGLLDEFFRVRRAGKVDAAAVEHKRQAGLFGIVPSSVKFMGDGGDALAWRSSLGFVSPGRALPDSIPDIAVEIV